MNNVKIRPAREEDLLQCEKIFDLPELATASGNKLPVAYLKHFLDEKYFLVAVEGEKVVGAIYGEVLNAGGLMMWALAVLPDYREKGVGACLLETFEQHAKADNRKWLVLHASTKTDKTVLFYKKHMYNIGNHYIECAKDLV